MKLPIEIQNLFNEIGKSLNAYTAVTDPKDPNFLGEPWRSHLLELKGQINASLENLPPTDQVPAAQEAAYGMNSLKYALLGVQSIINSLQAVVKSKSTETANALASITPQVEAGVEAKLKSGEFLKKSDADALVQNARKEGEDAGFARGKILADRRSALALAGLPAEVAGSAPEAILLGEEKDFNAARDAAKERVAKLTGVGLTVASASLLTLPWEKQDAFDTQFKTFEDIHKSAKGQSLNTQPVKAGAKPNGFVAGPGVAADPKKPAIVLAF